MRSIGRKIKRIALAFGIAGALYLGALFSVQGYMNQTSDNITSQNQLELILQREIDRASTDKDVRAALVGYDAAFSFVGEDDTNWIYLGGNGARSTNVRHELCHIVNNDFGDSANDPYLVRNLKYWFVQEPRATLCELTGNY